jgi:nucleotide-binding universal stress UspA family protein
LSKFLLAITDADHPDGALQYARALSRALNAELHVLIVLPALEPLRPSGNGDFDVEEARQRVERCVAACRQARTWWTEVLGEQVPTRRLRVRFGYFTDEVAARAGELDAPLVILAPSLGRLGAAATALVQACSRSVLVARGVMAPGVLVAATDLEDPRHRVVRRAVELGAVLDSSVVAVHNVSCLAAPPRFSTGVGVWAAPQLPRRVISQLSAPVDMVVTTEVDPVDAVLEQSRRRSTRMIVVGTRRPPRDKSRRVSVPAEIIDRSRCSVLVTSLEC